MRAKLKSSRADEVANVLNNDQPQLFQRELSQRDFDHIRVEMAIAAGVNLHRRHTSRHNFVGVDGYRGGVTFDDPQADILGQPFDGFEDKTGLSSSWRCHQIDAKGMVLIENRPVGLSKAVVGVHDFFNNFYALGHLRILS